MPDLHAPNPRHALFQKDVGTWDADVTVRFPGAPESVSRGVMTSRLAADGRWLISDFRNETSGFEGHGVFGWDEREGRYIGNWVDTMSTSFQLMKGDWDPERRTMTMEVEARGPDGQPVRMRQVTECPAPDRQVFRSFIPTPAGEHELMTVVYTRRQLA